MRYQTFVAPRLNSKNGLLVGLPNGCWTHGHQVPKDHEALGITSSQARVAPDEAGDMHLGLVAAEDVLWRRGIHLIRCQLPAVIGWVGLVGCVLAIHCA